MQIENCTVDEDAEGGNDWFYYKLCNVKTKLLSLRKKKASVLQFLQVTSILVQQNWIDGID